MWPHNVFAMETLVAALECAFHGLLDDKIRDLVDLGRGFGTSVIAERGHTVINDAARKSPHETISRVSKFHRVHVSPLMVDADRRVPTPTVSDRAEALTLHVDPSWFVVPPSEEFSMGSELLRSFETNHFPLTTAAALFESSVATSLALHCLGSPEKLRSSFLSLLAIRGSVIFEASKGLQSAQYVVSSCTSGVTTWTCEPTMKDKLRCFELRLRDDVRCWQFVHMTDLSDWRVQSVDILPPVAGKGGSPRNADMASF